jgi:magnesium transporter
MIDIYTYKAGEGLRHPPTGRAVQADRGPRQVTWVDLEDPDERRRSSSRRSFFHVLAIEDCIHSRSFPKIDVFEDHLFLVVHGILLDREKRDFANSPVNVFLGRNYLVTHHPLPVRSVLSTKALLSKSESAIARGPDFLLHTILDFLVDNYQPILD